MDEPHIQQHDCYQSYDWREGRTYITRDHSEWVRHEPPVGFGVWRDEMLLDEELLLRVFSRAVMRTGGT